MTPKQRECSEPLIIDRDGSLICRACGYGGVEVTKVSNVRQFSFDHEWYLGGVRMLPGEYEIKRVGEPEKKDEHPF
jgi:hypothetical protein